MKKKKRKIGKIILFGMSFFLTIVLTFTITLAWFYDSDWASKYIQMGGTVGIAIKDGNTFTHGENNLHFNITPANSLAYPGQAVDVSASCYNTGGRSGENGSACYVRARFAVYTNIGIAPNPDDYITDTYPDGSKNPDYIEDAKQVNNDNKLTSENLYAFLYSLIQTQNGLSTDTGYQWKYYRRTGSVKLTDSGTNSTTAKNYLEGEVLASEDTTTQDSGYFYLCSAGSDVLKPLNVGGEAVFLWNSTFTIPWQLTNASADKYLYVTLTFQAIQTYIPIIDKTTGTISQAANNQQDPTLCTYSNDSVQTVFNTCDFDDPPLKVTINETEVNFGDTTKYESTQRPTSSGN